MEQLNLNQLEFNSIAINALLTKYPEIQNILEALKSDPDCPCKEEVLDFLIKKSHESESDYNFLNHLIINNYLEGAAGAEVGCGCNSGPKKNEKPKLEITVLPTIVENEELYKVHKIGKNPEDWKEFIIDIRNRVLFTSISIIEKSDHLLVYLA